MPGLFARFVQKRPDSKSSFKGGTPLFGVTPAGKPGSGQPNSGSAKMKLVAGHVTDKR
jgi:hypothetical protein